MGRGLGACSDHVWPVTSGDHGPNVTPGVSTHIMQWPVLQWGLPSTADIHCGGQMWDWWLQRNWRPRCYPCEQLRALGGGRQSGRAIAGKCPAVVATLPHIAGYCQSVEHYCGKCRLSAKNNPDIIDLLFCSRKYWTFCFVCWFAQQTKMWLGAKLICWNWIVRPDSQRAPRSCHHQREEAGAGCAKHRLVSSRTGKKQRRERERW